MLSIDQLGNAIEFDIPPKRIISLVPSQTELLIDLGLQQKLVGITRFCIHPSAVVTNISKVGGTKNFDLETIKKLNPDLIVGNKEENYESGIAELKKHFPVWMSDIFNLTDVYSMMNELGRITNSQTVANLLINHIRSGFNRLPSVVDNTKTAAYFIWRKPYMVAAGNTFINSMLAVLGVKNTFETYQRYPEIKPEMLLELNPDFIFLSSEPYLFGKKHLDEFQSFAPGSQLFLVDGEMFSWYGSRLKNAPEYFAQLRKKIPI